MTRPFQIGKIYHDSGKPVTLPDFLADGETHRTPLMLKDGETNTVCDDCGGSGLYPASVRCPSCHGSGGSDKGKDSQLTDAETQMRDFIARDDAWRTETAGSRAGFRYAADTEATRASRQQLHDSYVEYERRITSEWKSLDSEYVASPSGEKNVGAGAQGRNFAQQPQIGSQCTINGRPGHIAENGECVADRGNEDSRTVSQVAADHAQNMENVYQEHTNFLQNAWRNLK